MGSCAAPATGARGPNLAAICPPRNQPTTAAIVHWQRQATAHPPGTQHPGTPVGCRTEIPFITAATSTPANSSAASIQAPETSSNKNVLCACAFLFPARRTRAFVFFLSLLFFSRPSLAVPSVVRANANLPDRSRSPSPPAQVSLIFPAVGSCQDPLPPRTTAVIDLGHNTKAATLPFPFLSVRFTEPNRQSHPPIPLLDNAVALRRVKDRPAQAGLIVRRLAASAEYRDEDG
jgi:hypothetical protein